MKPTNKNNRITIRLSPSQHLMIEEASEKLQLDKAKLMRYIIDHTLPEILMHFENESE